MDDRLPLQLGVVGLIVVLLLLMAWSWQRRKRRQVAYAVELPVPADTGAELARAEGLYLATTPAESRLDRVAVAGLGFRARLEVVVTETGVVLPIPGGADVFIAASAITAVGTASWTIDRGIEPAGLTVVHWAIDAKPVESYFRFDEPDAVVAAIQTLITTTAGSSTT
jgi:hypothetical protein